MPATGRQRRPDPATDAVRARVRAAVGPAVEAAGLYLEDVHVSRAGARSLVRVTLDLDEDALGSLSLDALADASRAVSDALDAADPFPGGYTLEVSTPGTSRPLTEPRHFKRARGRLVSVALRDGATLTGRLADVDDGTLVLTDVPAGQEDHVALDAVAHGAVEVELRRSGDDETHDDEMHDEMHDEETGEDA